MIALTCREVAAQLGTPAGRMLKPRFIAAMKIRLSAFVPSPHFSSWSICDEVWSDMEVRLIQ